MPPGMPPRELPCPPSLPVFPLLGNSRVPNLVGQPISSGSDEPPVDSFHQTTQSKHPPQSCFMTKLSTTSQHRHCPLLDRPGPTRVLDVAPTPWEVRECLRTGFVYLANPPAQARFTDEFAWEVTHAEESSRRRREEPLLYAASRAAKLIRQRWLKRDKLVGILADIVCRQSHGPIRLVDIGCADGDLFRRLVVRLPSEVMERLEPIGIEISTQLAARANRRLGMYHGFCLHASGIEGLRTLPRDYVGLVILSCVLEHELDPVPLLAACRERLAPDGFIVVKVPNYACLGRQLRGRRWCGYRWPDHVNYFTPRSLAATAERAGLRVARMDLQDRSPLSDSLYAVLAQISH